VVLNADKLADGEWRWWNCTHDRPDIRQQPERDGAACRPRSAPAPCHQDRARGAGCLLCVCHDAKTADVVKAIKNSLESEGMGDLAVSVSGKGDGGDTAQAREVKQVRRAGLSSVRVFLPRVTVGTATSRRPSTACRAGGATRSIRISCSAW